MSSVALTVLSLLTVLSFATAIGTLPLLMIQRSPLLLCLPPPACLSFTGALAFLFPAFSAVAHDLEGLRFLPHSLQQRRRVRRGDVLSRFGRGM